MPLREVTCPVARRARIVCRLGTALALLGALSCSTESTEPSAPVATVTIMPSVIWLAVGQTIQLSATLLDSAGNRLSARTVSWALSDTTYARIDNVGRLTVTALPSYARVGPRTTVIAKSEGKVGQQFIRFGGRPVRIVVVSGDTTVGASLPRLFVVFAIFDSSGKGVGGIYPTLSPAGQYSRYGSRDDGILPVEWYLPSSAGPKTLTASIPDATPATITVTVLPGSLGRFEKLAGDAQVAAPGIALPVRPSVRATDLNGNVIVGAAVRFSVTGGGGSVTGAEVVTDASGIATVGSWTLGPQTTTNSLSVTPVGSSYPNAQFTAVGR